MIREIEFQVTANATNLVLLGKLRLSRRLSLGKMFHLLREFWSIAKLVRSKKRRRE